MKYPINLYNKILGVCICFVILNTAYCQKYLGDLVKTKDTINKIDALGKQGKWYLYSPNSEILEAVLNYKNDTLNGYCEYYWANTGNIQARGFYENGELDSLYKTYWQNGKIREIYHVKGGKAHGIMQTFDKDSNLLTYNSFINGKMDTNFKDKFRAKNVVVENGQFLKMDTIKQESKYIKEKKYYIYKNDILYKEVGLTGKILNWESYRNYIGKEIKRIIYYPNKTNSIEKIFYWDNGYCYKVEYFNKKGEYLRTEIKDSEGKWVEDKNAKRIQSGAGISEE